MGRSTCCLILFAAGCASERIPLKGSGTGGSDATGTSTATGISTGISTTDGVTSADATSGGTISGSGSGSGSTTGASSAGFIDWPPPTDLPEGQCASQGDCEPGFKCMPFRGEDFGWGIYQCVEVVADPKLRGQPCTYLGEPFSSGDDCDATSFCYNLDADLLGQCVLLCDLQTYACPPTDMAYVGSGECPCLCLQACDPLAGDCPQNQTCQDWNSKFSCFPTAGQGPAQLGEPCGGGFLCTPGLVCAPASLNPGCVDDFCCAAWCDMSNPDCPDPGQSCLEWFDPGDAPPGYESLGVCGVP